MGLEMTNVLELSNESFKVLFKKMFIGEIVIHD
jgi:hypothetical protein